MDNNLNNLSNQISKCLKAFTQNSGLCSEKAIDASLRRTCSPLRPQTFHLIKWAFAAESNLTRIIHTSLFEFCKFQLFIMSDAPAAAPAPAKAKTPKKKAAPKKPAEHPKYAEMIAAAVAALKERTGSSRQAILKYIQANYKVGDNPTAINARLKTALKAGVKAGTLKQSKGAGASGSFKLGEKKKEAKKPKAKKPKSPKKAKKPAKKAAKSPVKKAAKPKKATKSPAKKAAKKPAAKKPAAKKPAAKKAKK